MLAESALYHWPAVLLPLPSDKYTACPAEIASPAVPVVSTLAAEAGVAAMLSAVTRVDPWELALQGVFSYVNLYDRPGVKNAVKRPAVDAMIGLALATDSATSV